MQYEKRSLVCLTLLYVLQTEVGGTSGPVAEARDGNYEAVLGSCKKNICQIIVSNILLLINSIKSIELVFSLRYVSFYLILN